MASIFSWEFYLSFFLCIQLDVLVGGLVGLRYTEASTITDFINIVVSLIVVIAYTLITVFIIVMVWRFNRQQKNKTDTEEIVE
jgi:heme/copper-type cytochrome/quinol oxidase subunit 2